VQAKKRRRAWTEGRLAPFTIGVTIAVGVVLTELTLSVASPVEDGMPVTEPLGTTLKVGDGQAGTDALVTTADSAL
jgi:hypothetical protein